MKQEQFLTVIDRDEAERRFRDAIGPLAPLRVEDLPLAEALGRVLASDIQSPIDVPGFDRSNVDGYALQAKDTFGAGEFAPKRIRCLPETVTMGALPIAEVTPGTAMAIPTGGVVPRGADAVIMVEHTRIDGDDIIIEKAITPGRHISWAGTDIACGETILRAPELITSRETGILAALGLATVSVFARPRVAILSTGDEIIPPGAPMTPGRIYDSNAAILQGAVREAGGEPIYLGIFPDDPDAIQSALQNALASADIVLLSGGTSKGPGDLNVRALERTLEPPGIVAHGVALKPGKPLCLAVSGNKPVVVLPGFPTSAIFTFHEFVAPVIRALAGRDQESRERLTARLPFRITSEIGRTEYTLVRLTEDDEGALVAYPIGKGSGSITTFCHADGYFVIPRQVEIVDKDEEISILALTGERARKTSLVIIGSHCVGLDILISRLRKKGITAKLIAVGSEAGLAAVRRGECDIAGAHLYDPVTGEYNAPFLEPGLCLLRGYGRLQGVLFRKGDARFEGKAAEEAFREAARQSDMMMINRNRGSGTRALYERLLEGQRPSGYGIEASSHHAVAAAIAQGRADFGVAIDIVAKDRGLGFLPLCEERFDFFTTPARKSRAAVAAFFAELEDPETRKALSARGLLT